MTRARRNDGASGSAPSPEEQDRDVVDALTAELTAEVDSTHPDSDARAATVAGNPRFRRMLRVQWLIRQVAQAITREDLITAATSFSALLADAATCAGIDPEEFARALGVALDVAPEVMGELIQGTTPSTDIAPGVLVRIGALLGIVRDDLVRLVGRDGYRFASDRRLADVEQSLQALRDEPNI